MSEAVSTGTSDSTAAAKPGQPQEQPERGVALGSTPTGCRRWNSPWPGW